MSIGIFQNRVLQGLSSDFPGRQGDPVVLPDQPTEFPTHDPGHWIGFALHSPAFWLLLYLLALIALFYLVHRMSKKAFIKGRALWVGDRINLWMGARQTDTGIEWLWKQIDAKLQKAWKAKPDDKKAAAESAHKIYESAMRNTLTLSRELNKSMGDLKKAVEGQKEVYPPQVPGSFAAGGAVINIAVNQGNTVSAQGDATQINHGTPGGEAHGDAKPEAPLSDSEQRQAIWKAIDRLYDYWKNKAQLLALFAGAQKQLTQAEPWYQPNNASGGWVPPARLSWYMQMRVNAKWKELRKRKTPPQELVDDFHKIQKLFQQDIESEWPSYIDQEGVPQELVPLIVYSLSKGA